MDEERKRTNLADVEKDLVRLRRSIAGVAFRPAQVDGVSKESDKDTGWKARLTSRS